MLKFRTSAPVAPLARLAGLALCIVLILSPAISRAQALDSALIKQLSAEGLSLDDLANLQVIGVTRTAQRSSDAPATVRIVTADQIRLRGYQSLSEVLADLPDIKIETNSDPRWQNDVQIRGVFGMDKFIILLDGVRISSPTNEIIPVMENYPVNLARQIEVVYGPASAVYGADALAGVINIVTKKPEDLTQGAAYGAVPDAGFQGMLQGGQYDTFIGNFVAARKVSDLVRFTITGQYFYDRQPQLDAVRDYRKNGGDINDFHRSGMFPTDLGFTQTTSAPLSTEIANPITTYGLYGSLQIGDLRLNVFRNYSHTPSSTANKPNNAVYNESNYFGHAVTMFNATYATFFGSNFGSTTFLTYSLYDLDNQSNFRNAFTNMNPAYLFSLGRMFKAEELLTYTATNELSLTGGITFETFFAIPRGHDLENVVSDAENPSSPIVGSTILPGYPQGIAARFFKLNYNNLGTFAQVQYMPVPELILTLGARADRDSRFAATFNPRLGVVYRPSARLTAKALYGSAFLAPSPSSAYDEFGSFFPTGDPAAPVASAFMRLSNPDLGPQRIQTFELSLRAGLTDELSVSVQGYYNLLSGLFSQVSDAASGNRYNGAYPLAPGVPVFYIETIINQGNQTNYGGTVQVDYVQKFSATNRVALYAALSLVDGTVDVLDTNSVNRGLVRSEIGGVSPVMFRIGGDVVIDNFSFSPRLIVATSQRSHPQQGAAFQPGTNNTKRNLIAGYALLNLTARYQILKQAAVFVRVQNALNQNIRNVNLGAGVPEGGGSAQVEFPEGAPQNPVRATAGIQFQF
ncbi:MAG: TonB-dependent receptor [Rhizobacter sp.]|nr:TonB-dependent receptor [Chlorobiales bacterium]